MNFNLYFKSRQGEMISLLKELVRMNLRHRTKKPSTPAPLI